MESLPSGRVPSFWCFAHLACTLLAVLSILAPTSAKARPGSSLLNWNSLSSSSSVHGLLPLGVLPSAPSELGSRAPGAAPALAERVVTLGAPGSGRRDEGFLIKPGTVGASVDSAALARYRASLTSLGTILIRDESTGRVDARESSACQTCAGQAWSQRLHGSSPVQPLASVPYG